VASGPEPEGVVTVRRSGGSLITTIPARVARRLGIRKGMELTVYLTYDEDLDTEAILYVPKRGRGPRPAPSQRYVGSSRSPRKPGHEAPRWEGAGKSRMGVKASNALAGQNGGREAPADEGLSSGARQECPRGACAEQSPLEKLAGKCYIKQSPTGICFGRERRSGPQNAERSQGSTCFGRELAANSKPQSPRGAERLTAREARQEQPVLMADGGSEGCCGRCKHYDIWRGKCSLNGEKRSPHAPACERFHDITSSTKKHGLTCGDCQYFTIMPDLTTWCKFWEMPVSPDRPACDKFMM